MNIPVHFLTKDLEPSKKLEVKKGRKQTGFTGTIEAVKNIGEEEEDVGVCTSHQKVFQKYELRSEFVKFAIPNFMKWMSGDAPIWLLSSKTSKSYYERDISR